MKRHIDNCPRRTTRDVGQFMINQSDGNVGIRRRKFDPTVFRDLLSAAICLHDLPFQFVEYRGIRRIFSYLNEDVNMISRNTTRADVLKIYSREKARIKGILEGVPGRISLTSDLWTSITTDGYLCLTAHFIDKDWVLQKKVLNFSAMSPPHSGIALSDTINRLLIEWGIEKKIFSITLDNASSNDTCVEFLKSQLNFRKALLGNGEFFHIRCCAHILNLVVQEGLREIDGAIRKIRESIKYVKGSQVRKKTFLECVKQVSLDSKKCLRQDVPTRWNSTYLMLESVIYYREAFCHMKLSDCNYIHCPSPDEWEKIANICGFLSVFYETTCIFSGTKYPTSSLYFPKVFMAHLTLKQNLESEHGYLKDMANLMLIKFEKYWSNYCVILAMAIILDPRYKMQFVEFAYKKLYGDAFVVEFGLAREKLFSLFNEYRRISISSASSSSRSRDFVNLQDILVSTTALDDVMKEFDDFESDDQMTLTQKTQLELYLDEPRVERSAKLDILQYWKGNEFRYPELACMARDILSIPISTVASESAFSVGGRVLDQYRSTLKPDTVEALICTRDWLFGEEQERGGIKLDELTEDIMNMSINQGESIESSTMS